MLNSATTVFRTLFESGKINDSETMASTLAADCEWVMMPNICKKGKLASDKTPEIMTDVATAEWSVFEHMKKQLVPSPRGAAEQA